MSNSAKCSKHSGRLGVTKLLCLCGLILAGAGANTRDSPANVTDYMPSEKDIGGWFDDASRAKRIYASKSQSVQQQQKQHQAQQQGKQMQRGGSATALAEAVAAATAEHQQQQQGGLLATRQPLRER